MLPRPSQRRREAQRGAAVTALIRKRRVKSPDLPPRRARCSQRSSCRPKYSREISPRSPFTPQRREQLVLTAFPASGSWQCGAGGAAVQSQRSVWGCEARAAVRLCHSPPPPGRGPRRGSHTARGDVRHPSRPRGTRPNPCGLREGKEGEEPARPQPKWPPCPRPRWRPPARRLLRAGGGRARRAAALFPPSSPHLASRRCRKRSRRPRRAGGKRAAGGAGEAAPSGRPGAGAAGSAPRDGVGASRRARNRRLGCRGCGPGVAVRAWPCAGRGALASRGCAAVAPLSAALLNFVPQDARRRYAVRLCG